MSTYTPDAWVLLEITVDKDPPIYKILAGWYGGFINGDHWRLNSGITSVIDRGNYWEVHGYSSSIYVCYKTSERFSGLTQYIFNSFKKKASENVVINHIEMSNDINFGE